MKCDVHEEAYLTARARLKSAEEGMRQSMQDFGHAFDTIRETHQTVTMEDMDHAAEEYAEALSAYKKARAALVKTRRKGRAT